MYLHKSIGSHRQPCDISFPLGSQHLWNYVLLFIFLSQTHAEALCSLYTSLPLNSTSYTTHLRLIIYKIGNTRGLNVRAHLEKTVTVFHHHWIDDTGLGHPPSNCARCTADLCRLKETSTWSHVSLLSSSIHIWSTVVHHHLSWAESELQGIVVAPWGKALHQATAYHFIYYMSLDSQWGKLQLDWCAEANHHEAVLLNVSASSLTPQGQLLYLPFSHGLWSINSLLWEAQYIKPLMARSRTMKAWHAGGINPSWDILSNCLL